MEKMREFLLMLADADLTGSAYQAVLSLVLNDVTFKNSDYAGKLREALPPFLVDHGLFTRKGKGTAIKYEPTQKLLDLRALLRAPAAQQQAAALENQPVTVLHGNNTTAAILPDPTAHPGSPAAPRTTNPAPRTLPLFPWATAAAAKFLGRSGEQQAITIKKWRALGYEGDMADLLIDACYKIQQGQELQYSATLAEAARNAEVLAAKIFG
jgi:hypothetical protein